MPVLENFGTKAHFQTTNFHNSDFVTEYVVKYLREVQAFLQLVTKSIETNTSVIVPDSVNRRVVWKP